MREKDVGLERAFGNALMILGWRDVPCYVARRFGERLFGMGAVRDEGAVLVLPACRAVHTCFMHAPLDIAFIDEAGDVLRYCHAVPPWRFMCHPEAVAVLERYAGVPVTDTDTLRFHRGGSLLEGRGDMCRLADILARGSR